jgi:hypothetical protein
MLWKRIIVGDGERALLTKNERFGGILSPGAYGIFVAPGMSLEVEKYSLNELVFRSEWADYLIRERPEIADRHFTRIETSDVQVAMVYLDGKLFKVLPPAKRLLFWRGRGEVSAEIVDVIANPEVPVDKVPALERMGREFLMAIVAVNLRPQITEVPGREICPLCLLQSTVRQAHGRMEAYCPPLTQRRNQTAPLLKTETRTNNQAAA